MEIKQLDQIIITTHLKKDSLDTPDCYGEYSKKKKLCKKYCSVSIKCCIAKNNGPKIDVLEKFLIQNYYAAKLH